MADDDTLMAEFGKTWLFLLLLLPLFLMFVTFFWSGSLVSYTIGGVLGTVYCLAMYKLFTEGSSGWVILGLALPLILVLLLIGLAMASIPVF